MNWLVTKVLVNFLISFIFVCVVVHTEKFSTSFEWRYLNFTWDSSDNPEATKLLETFIPGDDVIAGIKIYKEVVYLALPRIKKSARITMATIPLHNNKKSPLLNPYPNWSMNLGNDCETLQNVQSMEIDREGIMWVLDGRRDTKHTQCPPVIIMFDLNNKDKIIRRYVVPDNLCSHNNGCFLNDIVIDDEYAYISDMTMDDPGIVVYNKQLNAAWKLRDQSMYGDPRFEKFMVEGLLKQGVDYVNGIALSPKSSKGLGNRTLYYMAPSSATIYSISTKFVKDPEYTTQNASKYITSHGTKQGQCGGMICDHEGNIYYGLLPIHAVCRWNTSTSLENAEIIDQNRDIITWADSFSFDNNGNLYLITNNLLRFMKIGINITQVNYRIIKYHTATQSYLFS